MIKFPVDVPIELDRNYVRQRNAIVMLNEVKHLAGYQCDSKEMFRCAQHDSVPTAFLLTKSNHLSDA
jgi:hypothetical protein